MPVGGGFPAWTRWSLALFECSPTVARFMENNSNPFKAFVAPFGAFILVGAAGSLAEHVFKGSDSLLITGTQYWVYPLQALICGAIIAWFWPIYSFGHVRKYGFTIAIALIVLGIWIAPQILIAPLFHLPPRNVGFDPTLFSNNPTLFTTVLGLRFLRLVLVVPLMEEIFWRGFLLRDFIDNQDFTRVPFGTYTRNSCLFVALAFALAHWGPDFVPALITGVLYNWVAYRTRSLASCVVAHSITNLILGAYIMQTKQWGFW